MNVLLSYGSKEVMRSSSSRQAPPVADLLTDLFGDDRARWPSILFDSGAFQMRNETGAVTIDGYGAWLREGLGLWDGAFNLDVIGDEKASLANHRHLLDEYGLDTVPVFHGGEPWSYFDDMVTTRPGALVALGGMVQAGGRGGLKPWIARAFRDRKDAELHGLGVTTWPLLTKAPWASVDSSSWGVGHRYGIVAAWTGRRLITGRAGDARHRRVVREVLAQGFTAADLGYYQTVAVVNAYAWLQMERALQVTRPDFRLYLVEGARFEAKRLMQAADLLED